MRTFDDADVVVVFAGDVFFYRVEGGSSGVHRVVVHDEGVFGIFLAELDDSVAGFANVVFGHRQYETDVIGIIKALEENMKYLY